VTGTEKRFLIREINERGGEVGKVYLHENTWHIITPSLITIPLFVPKPIIRMSYWVADGNPAIIEGQICKKR
jgi:hypothetical protein